MKVYGVSRSSLEITNKDFRESLVDLSSFAPSDIDIHRLDYVIHAAGSSDWTSIEQDSEQHRAMCARVLDLARTRSVRKFLFLSSGSVVSPTKDNYASGEEYKKGKLSCERMLSKFQPFMHITVARIYGVIGPYMPNHFAASQFMKQGLSDCAVKLAGNGLSVRSYMYPTDLVVWLLTILINGKSLIPYSVGSSEPIYINELAHKIANLFKVKVSQTPSRSVPTHYVPMTLATQKNLSLDFKVTLDQSLFKTVEWFKINPVKITRGKNGNSGT